MTREEAIERIKARFDKWALDDEDMKAIQTLIPELAESEDERIRKEIKHHISLLEFYRFMAASKEECLAYLEKQKESLHISETCKESADSFTDDERIRKKLIEIIGYFRSRGIDQQLCEEFIAYLEKQKEQKKKNVLIWGDPQITIDVQKPAEWSEDTIRKAVKEVGLTQHQIDWFKNNVFPPKQEWGEEDEKKLERVDDLLWMLDDYISDDCSICEERTARLRDEIHNELFPWLEFLRPQPKQEWSEEDKEMIYSLRSFLIQAEQSGRYGSIQIAQIEQCLNWLKDLRPQYHGDVTMTEAYKIGLEAGKASSWKPSEKQTNNVIVELTRIELGDIINGLYYLKEKYYEDCKEHNGTATVGLSDEFKFYFKRFNEVLDLYTRLHELEKEKYGTTTDGYYYE